MALCLLCELINRRYRSFIAAGRTELFLPETISPDSQPLVCVLLLPLAGALYYSTAVLSIVGSLALNAGALRSEREGQTFSLPVFVQGTRLRSVYSQETSPADRDMIKNSLIENSKNPDKRSKNTEQTKLKMTLKTKDHLHCWHS